MFFHPKGEFEIINSSKMYMDRNQTMVDADFAKKIETDALTKALSKLGFNADVFMGRFDDTKYVLEMKEKFKPEDKELELIIKNQNDVKWVTDNWGGVISTKWIELSLQLTTILNNTYNGTPE